MNMSVDGAFIYFTIPIFGGIPITQTTVSSFLVTIFLCFAAVRLGKGLKKRPGGAQVLVEKGILIMRNMVVDRTLYCRSAYRSGRRSRRILYRGRRGNRVQVAVQEHLSQSESSVQNI